MPLLQLLRTTTAFSLPRLLSLLSLLSLLLLLLKRKLLPMHLCRILRRLQRREARAPVLHLRLLLLLLDQIALDAAQVLDGELDEVARFGAVFERLQHLADLRLGADVRAGAPGAEVRESAQVAVLDARELERAGADEVGARAGRAAPHVAGGNRQVRRVARRELRFGDALEL